LRQWMYSEDKLRVWENYVVVGRVLRKRETDATVPNIVCVSECGYMVADGKHRLTDTYYVSHPANVPYPIEGKHYEVLCITICVTLCDRHPLI
jgi:hypothetical protein